MRRFESLSVEGMGLHCSATSCGNSGGGRDWVPVIVEDTRDVRLVVWGLYEERLMQRIDGSVAGEDQLERVGMAKELLTGQEATRKAEREG